MNSTNPLSAGAEALAEGLRNARRALKPPPQLGLVEWADTYRFVAQKTSASPGRWRTAAQPVTYGPMSAVTERDTHTVTLMAATQVLKSELLINTALYFAHQDPSAILFVQPTQNAARDFSKERFSPTVEISPAISTLIRPPRSRDSENTITHKSFPGGSLDFVGANSPTDLASRPKRIILCDEVDKYPPSAGAEGDPLKLAEERASTYKKLKRAKFVRTCSPTVKGLSRIGREYEASDQRKCYLACPHCGFEQTLGWAHVRWSKDALGRALAHTARVACDDCGALWTEPERISALNALAHRSDYGWRQTKQFVCCDVDQLPASWNERGRALCDICNAPAAYEGHAGFQISKLYSKRHDLADIVTEFLEAQHDHELLRKWTNTALAELWEVTYGQKVETSGLLARAEAYGPQDLPDQVQVITGFCDVQGDRLEVQLIGWGQDEEAWPFQYTIIYQDPAQPAAWAELDAVLRGSFQTRAGRTLRISAFGIDTGGHHAAEVYGFCRPRRGRRIFPTKGVSGPKPLWPGRASRAKLNDLVYVIGVDAGKDALAARLKIQTPEAGYSKPGFIHFPAAENFGPDYFEQLTSEYREIHRRMGQDVARWIKPPGKRNEALDTFVGALAVRRSLPRRIEAGLQYTVMGAKRPRAVVPRGLAESEAAEPPAALPQPVAAPVVADAQKRRKIASMLAK